MKKKYLLIVILLSVVFVYAHQPRLVYEQDLSLKNPKIIENPEISQAFYGELRGKIDFYKIISDKDFDLYINVLAPDVKDARTDFSVDVYGDNNIINLNGERYEWEKFFEKFSGDNYLKGPEYEERVGKGEYLIQVYNPGNQGKYVLVVGEKEAFTPKEAINAIISMPKLKSFFQRSPLTAYFNLIGLFTLINLIVIIGIILLIIFIIRRISNSNPI
jgi:hypothetical protein